MARVDVQKLLEDLGLTKYQTRVLIALMQCGESKASEVSKLSGVPRAKVYGVLDQLVDMGLVDKKPGRPVTYVAKEPEDIVERLKLNVETEYLSKIQKLEKNRNYLLKKLEEVYTPKSREPKELIRIVRVGEPSERETRLMILNAKNEVNVVSKVFEYYPKVREELMDACSRGVKIRVLLLSKDLLDGKGRSVQRTIVKMIERDLNAEIRFSRTSLPLRGVIVDPSYDYKSGKAIFVVEDPTTPLYLRDAAITENPSLVAGMKKYFELIWEYESEV